MGKIKWEDLDKQYTKVPIVFFWKYWIELSDEFPEAFKVSYSSRKGFGHAREMYWVENDLLKFITTINEIYGEPE